LGYNLSQVRVWEQTHSPEEEMDHIGKPSIELDMTITCLSRGVASSHLYGLGVGGIWREENRGLVLSQDKQ